MEVRWLPRTHLVPACVRPPGERARPAPQGLLAISSYLFEVAGLPGAQLETILTDITKHPTHKMISAADDIRRKVRPKYEAAGQARQLVRLLKKKFGPLPPRLVARVKRASTPTLDGWFDRVLTAKILDEVFAEG